MLRSAWFSPNAFTRVVMFFLASGRLMARMTGLRGFLRKRNTSCSRSRFNTVAPGDDTVEGMHRQEVAKISSTPMLKAAEL